MDSISETAQSMGNTGETTKFKNLNQDHSSEHEWREREKEARRADTLAVLEGAVEGESEAKDKYSPKHGRRASRAKARSHLGKLEGKLDGETEYGDRFTESAREGETRAKFKLDQTLITPYGNFASSAVRLGDSRRYRSA